MRGLDVHGKSKLARLPAAVIVAFVLATCGSSVPAGASATGTVTGRVTAGPTCPVERADHPCPPRPVVATIDARDKTGRIVASTRSAKDGRYALRLPSGVYSVVAVIPARYPRCTPVKVTVIAGHTTRANISCDTGIR